MKQLFFFIVTLIFLLSISTSHASGLNFVDELGRRVVLAGPPQRIVSLAPSVTEILFSLGLDEQIVGVATPCNFPGKAKTKAQLGTYLNPDMEKIVSLRPDVVFATGAGNNRSTVERLQELGLPTYVVFPKNFEGILGSIRHLGHVNNREKEALRITQRMQARSQKVIEVTRGLRRPNVFFQIGDAPIITVGRDSFADDLIRLAGGVNIAGTEKEMYPRLGIEEVLRRAPEVILISSMNPKGDYERTIQEWARWKIIPAVRDDRIYLIDSDLIDCPSPRIIDGLEEMARILHPQQFRK